MSPLRDVVNSTAMALMLAFRLPVSKFSAIITRENFAAQKKR